MADLSKDQINQFVDIMFKLVFCVPSGLFNPFQVQLKDETSLLHKLTKMSIFTCVISACVQTGNAGGLFQPTLFMLGAQQNDFGT